MSCEQVAKAAMGAGLCALGTSPPSTPPAPLRCRRWRGDDARERATNHFPGPGFILPRPPNRHRLEPFHIRRGSSDDFPLGALTLAACLSDAACVPLDSQETESGE